MEKFRKVDLTKLGYEDKVDGYKVEKAHTVVTHGGETPVKPGDYVLADFPGSHDRGIYTVHTKQELDALVKSVADAEPKREEDSPAKTTDSKTDKK